MNALSYLSKQEMNRAISEFSVHFVLISKQVFYLPYASIYKENVKKFRDLDDFLNYEKELAKKSLLERLNE